MNSKPLIEAGLVVISGLVLGAFSPDVAREILSRDRWHCYCGHHYRDGWMLHASHIDHSSNGYYNDPQNGQAECIPCHLQRHVNLVSEDPTMKNIRALELLSQYAYAKGFHTDKYYENNPNQLEIDRQQLIQGFEGQGIDPRIYVLNLNDPSTII